MIHLLLLTWLIRLGRYVLPTQASSSLFHIKFLTARYMLLLTAMEGVCQEIKCFRFAELIDPHTHRCDDDKCRTSAYQGFVDSGYGFSLILRLHSSIIFSPSDRALRPFLGSANLMKAWSFQRGFLCSILHTISLSLLKSFSPTIQ